MRAKSLSANDFLYVSLAFRQANIVAVSSVLAAGDAARLLEFLCPSNENGIRLLKLIFDSSNESGCDILGKVLVFLATVKSGAAPGQLLYLCSVAQLVGESMLARQAEVRGDIKGRETSHLSWTGAYQLPTLPNWLSEY